jgi:CyaY protein
MNESEFNQLADAVLTKIETAVDECGVDINRSGNVLEIEFDNGQKIIINRHDINREIWVAAKSGAYHFAYQDGHWISGRDNSELFSVLSALFALQDEKIIW